MNNTSLVGNLTADPDLRFSSEGNPRASFSLAINEGQGDNEVTHFVRVTAFGTLGENVAESLHKGVRVVVVGRINTYTSEFTLEDGSTKRVNNLAFTASAVGPDLRWARARVAKVDRAPAEQEAPAAKASSNGHTNGHAGGDDFEEEAEAPKASAAKASNKKPPTKQAPTKQAPAEEDFEDEEVSF